MKLCRACQQEIPTEARFCPKCGRKIFKVAKEDRQSETLNIRILYIMTGLLILALLFPPWETATGEPPEYLGFHFVLSSPRAGAIVSRILQTIELVTIAVAGLYGAWVLRERGQ